LILTIKWYITCFNYTHFVSSETPIRRIKDPLLRHCPRPWALTQGHVLMSSCYNAGNLFVHFVSFHLFLPSLDFHHRKTATGGVSIGKANKDERRKQPGISRWGLRWSGPTSPGPVFHKRKLGVNRNTHFRIAKLKMQSAKYKEKLI